MLISLTLICSLLLIEVTESAKQNLKENSILELRIDSLKVENASVEEALKLLRGKDSSQILIGFEKITDARLGKNISISFVSENESVRDILRRIFSADTRYTYSLVSNSLIEVFPVGSKNDMSNLLNMRVKKFSYEKLAEPSYIITDIDRIVPELSEFLERNRQEYSKRSGIEYGFGGSIPRGNQEREISLELRDVTVREILNAAALLSLQLFREHGFLIPVGWKYEFVVDPTAPTGLGGYPKWDIF